MVNTRSFFNRSVLTIGVLWGIIATSSVAFERIHDDEVIYFLQASQISHGNIIAHANLIFIPQLLASGLALLFNNIIGVRIVSSLIVLLTAILMYLTGKNRQSFTASMLYLFSFYTIRFGFRYYLDPFGSFFAVLAVYSIYKASGFFAGLSSLLAAFSRQLAVPLVPVFALVTYRKRTGVRTFALGALVIVILGTLWLNLASGITATVGRGGTITESITAFDTKYLPSLLGSWIEYSLLSPLVLIGILFAKGIRDRAEFYPMIASALILSLTPGFLYNGAATEYPYIFNTMACFPAGIGLCNIYDRLNLNINRFNAIFISTLVILFTAQSYLATIESPNGIIGVQDFGYWNDMALISYLNTHYSGGKIYGSNLDGILSPKLSSNWVWMPQSIQPALKDSPEWLVTFRSYVNFSYIPRGVNITYIGPFVVVNTNGVQLSSFATATNVSSWKL
jgi:hypothetical protein